MPSQIQVRTAQADIYQQALSMGLAPILAQVLACRLHDFKGDLASIVHPALSYIPAPSLLADVDMAAHRLLKAIAKGEKIGVLTDYDVDGITSHVVILHAFLDFFGVKNENIFSFIGHRIHDGYGISHALVKRILSNTERPSLIITADCGSSDEERIALLKDAGIDVIVTDHHAIPVEGIPISAYAVVNPTRADCSYPDTSIAGCMVAWLLMAHVRQTLIDAEQISANVPKLVSLLDFVALGTVADCVNLSSSAVNRAVVHAGLHILNRFHRPCWLAIREMLKKTDQSFDAQILAFQIGPRINARSRMADPYAALHYLLSEDDAEAMQYLQCLDTDNQQRKAVEQAMVLQAIAQVEKSTQTACSIAYLEDGHAGVQGIVASRLVQKFGRPAVVLCPTKNASQLTASARSIAGVHIRDVLQEVANKHDFLTRFGGHSGAAGLGFPLTHLPTFKLAFEDAVRTQIGEKELQPIIWSDGSLKTSFISLEVCEQLQDLQPYGREFEMPIFDGVFEVQSIKTMGKDGTHLSLQLERDQKIFRAVWFGALNQAGDALPCQKGDKIHCAYQLNINDFRNVKQIQLMIESAFVIH
ncbi:MAG: single-stranded-DNA-specific exonuclease RecJ [Mariprofundaceae bacterium]|nr:single-stranded-DNA-specific exonuclease RecJ [Mariprofundaceae bacterium]